MSKRALRIPGWLIVVAAAAMAGELQAAKPIDVSGLGIQCIEVELISVATEKVEGQTDRAAEIPPTNLEIIRDRMLVHVPREFSAVTAVAAGNAACPDPAASAVLRGQILDFRKGNMALRYLVGFGAGSQKVRARLSLHRKADDTLIVESEAKDTKWGGIIGGTNTKGLDDFAEKAVEAIVKALRAR